MLTRVDARLRSLVKSSYRRRYAISNLAAFGVITASLIALALIFGMIWEPQGVLAVLPRYAVYCAFGALGAFLSVLTRIRLIEFDLDLNTWEHAFSGATRILIGVIGAIVVGLALDSNFMDPTFGGNDVLETGTPQVVAVVDPPAGVRVVQPPAAEEPAPQPPAADGDAPDPARAPEADAVPSPAPAVQANPVLVAGEAALPPGMNINLIMATAGERETTPSRVGNILAMYLIFAFLAGFSESLVPSILAKGEPNSGGRSRLGTDDPIVEDMNPS